MFTDEELSRILTAHAQGGLERYGFEHYPAYPACILQVALVCSNALDAVDLDGSLDSIMGWFDSSYDPNWTPEQFLQYLENLCVA